MSERYDDLELEGEMAGLNTSPETAQELINPLPIHRFAYWFPTLICRIWVTINAAITGLFWTESWEAFWILVCVAVAVDVLRQFTATDLTKDPKEIVFILEKGQEEIRSGQRKYSLNWFPRIMCLVPLFCISALLIFEKAANGLFWQYVRFFQPLYDFFEPFYRPVGKYAAQLTELGFPQLIPFVSNVHLTGLAIVWGVWVFAFRNKVFEACCNFELRLADPAYVETYIAPNPERLKKLKVIPIGGFFLYLLVLSASALQKIQVKTVGNTNPYLINESSYYYLTDSIIFGSIIFFSIGIYLFLFRLRLIGLGVWHLTKSEQVIAADYQGETI